MILSKEDMRFYIREDKKRNLGAYRINAFKYLAHRLYNTDGIKCFRLLRALRRVEYARNVLRKRGVWGNMLFYFRQWQYHRLSERYNVIIGHNMVGYGFTIPHIVGGGIIINCNSIGNYCSANAGVVVGNNKRWDDRPVIGDNVKLCVGSKVVGGVHIGSNCIVAPNSVVVKDVPDNCVVSGIPAKIIKKDGEKYNG